MSRYPFAQVDVFGSSPLSGNPVAVVADAADLSEATMQAVARWTNLSETTFLLPPTDPAADYRVRIFTTDGELPFAGHPTLGSAHAWVAAGNRPRAADHLVQECAAGLVEVRLSEGAWAFAAPPLLRYEPVEDALLDRVATGLGLARHAVEDASWVDNGPHWLAVRLESAQAVLAVEPDHRTLAGLYVGVVGPHAAGGPAAVEVRGLMGNGTEDPVTGSLNAGLARWLTDTGQVPERYVAAQGTALGRAGRVHVSREGERIWVGGATRTVVAGDLLL